MRQKGFTLIELLIVVAIIGDTRTVISAEAAYHSASSGYYGTCLSTPSGCLPSYKGRAFSTT